MLSEFLHFLCVFLIFSFLFLLRPLSGSPQFHASSFCISFLLSTSYVGAPKPGGAFHPEQRPWKDQEWRLHGRLSPRQPWDLRHLCSLGSVSASACRVKSTHLRSAASKRGPGLCGAWPRAWKPVPTSHPPASPSLGSSCRTQADSCPGSRVICTKQPDCV